MASTRTRDVVLTGIGFAAWLLFILACASFSPDDSKIVFPSNEAKTGAPAVAVYDRAARTTRTVFVFHSPELGSSDAAPWMRSVWTPDGKRIVTMWLVADEGLMLTVLPFGTGGTTRFMLVKASNSDVPSVFLAPPPIVGSWLLFGSKDGIVRVDLETGEQQTVETTGSPILSAGPNRAFYLRKAKAPGSDSDLAEVGSVDPKTLALTPLLKTKDADGDGLFAVSRDGSRVALTNTRPAQVLIFVNGQLRRTIPVAKDAGMMLGTMHWSPNAATLYAVFRKTTDDSTHQFGVMEIPAETGAPREVPLLVVHGSMDDAEALTFQLDVSHDGKTLAAASTYLQTPLGKQGPPRLRPEDLALYLVDVSKPDRKVTKVPIPPLPAPPPAPAK
jgi:hypothetical protein